MNIQYVPIDKLKPNPNNPNRHSKEQIDRLSELIKYQGWRLPIIVSNQSGLIVSGHGRLEAAKIAFLISDNAISSWAEMDLALVSRVGE